MEKDKETSISVLAGRSVLVTGGGGFIGRHLCLRLQSIGAHVTSISRKKRVEAIHLQVDLTDFSATRRLFESTRPDYIFHLASHVYGAPDLQHVLPTFHNNLQTTVNLLTAAAETGCKRFVLAGSLVEPDHRGDEEVPSCPYAAAKWASSDYGRMFHALYHLPVTIARVFMVYGPGQEDVSKLVPYVIQSLQDNESPRITSGRRQIDWIYVSDVVEGFLSLATAKGMEGKSADLGSGNLISTQDLVILIASLMRSSLQPTLGAVPDRPLEQVRAADVEHTYNMIKWRPVVPLNDGLRRTIDFFRGKEI
jgi:nucleoside-diphosphate-sugar epimerase